jgi:hypothetical protein
MAPNCDRPGRSHFTRWTGAYIFENEWQSFRTRQDRDLELTTASRTYAKAGRYMISVPVIDIFGNDTMDSGWTEGHRAGNHPGTVAAGSVWLYRKRG